MNLTFDDQKSYSLSWSPSLFVFEEEKVWSAHKVQNSAVKVMFGGRPVSCYSEMLKNTDNACLMGVVAQLYSLIVFDFPLRWSCKIAFAE